MSEEVKMSERFGSVPEFSIKEFISDDATFPIPNVHMLYDAIDHAVNNHDTLTEQVRQLREIVESGFKEALGVGYSIGLSDGQSYSSSKCNLDKDEEWQDSEAKQLLEATK